MAGKAKDNGIDDDGATVIKKYANRRLYNTASSSYITLEDLAKMVREKVDFVVVDAKSGEDITRSILTQIIMEEEAKGGQMLPVSFLRDLIGMYGNSMQSMMPSYLEASMSNFRKNQNSIRKAFEESMSSSPLTAIHESNMAMMRAAAQTFMPGMGIGATSKPDEAQEAEPESSTNSDGELAALREQMEAMQKKLDELGK